MKAPAEISTARLFLRRPTVGDIEDIFERYASDAACGRYLAWPLHETVDDTRAFLEFSDSEWAQWPAGPYLVFAKDTRMLLGSTGLAFETPQRATTGYVFAKDAWGNGFATEVVRMMKLTAAQAGVRRLSACCHPDHQPSRHVLEKCGFALEGTLRQCCEFPNLAPGELLDAVSYSWSYRA